MTTISRRRLLTTLAGAAGSAAAATQVQANKVEQSSIDWEEPDWHEARLTARVGLAAGRVAHFELEDGSLIMIVQGGDRPVHIERDAHVVMDVDVFAHGAVHVRKIHVNGTELNIFQLQHTQSTTYPIGA